MANYETLKTAIQQVIKTNDNNEITGALLQQSLLAIINSLGIGYQFVGIATPTTNPEIYDQKVFYIANGKGLYKNFGSINIDEDEVVLLIFENAWTKVLTGIASNSKLTALFNDVKTDVAAIERDLGQYAEFPSVAMTAETTGKYINADGEFVDDADFNIAAIGAVVVGNTYELYMGNAANMKLGVALFVARIKTTTTSGTERIEYVPLFSAMSTDIPTSGYVCFEAMEAYSDVLVCYRADVPEAATLLVRRYGTKASIATQINNLRKKVDLKSFADGYYESMRVGTADNLTSKGDATEEIIMSRKAGGDNQIEDGSASIKRIKGYSVVLNQLAIYNQDTVTMGGVTMTRMNNGEYYLFNGTSDSQVLFIFFWYENEIIGHHYFQRGKMAGTRETYYFDGPVGADLDGNGVIDVCHTKYQVLLYINEGQTLNNVKLFPQFIDLTQMFGSGNEPTTLEDFAKRLGYSSINDVPYIPYNEGEIVSSFAEGIKTTDTEGKVSERKWSETLKKYFPDGLKSAGSAYDEITPTKAVKRIGEIDLGTLTWGTTSANGKTYYHTKEAIPNRSANSYVVTSCYTTENRYPSQIQESESIDRIIGYKGYFIGEELWVIDSRYDTPEAFAAAMSGIILYYVLATPEETAYDELNLTEQVSEGGTEEAIITEGKTSTPLREDIVYPIDAYNTIKANKANIGTLSSLNTASKTDLVSAINELAGKVASLEATATEVTNKTTE